MQSGSRGGGKENRFSVSKPHLARGERKRRQPDRWEGHVAAWRLPRGSPNWGPTHRHPALWGPDGLLPANSSSPRRTRGCAEGAWGPAPQAPAPQDVHSLGFARRTQGGPGRAGQRRFRGHPERPAFREPQHHAAAHDPGGTDGEAAAPGRGHQPAALLRSAAPPPRAAPAQAPGSPGRPLRSRRGAQDDAQQTRGRAGHLRLYRDTR